MSTPADIHAACLTALEQAKAVLTAGTSGPWTTFDASDPTVELGPWWQIDAADGTVTIADVGPLGTADAALITDAVNTRAAGLALAEMVLEDHRPAWTDSHGHTWCSTHHRSNEWPCPLARTAALTVGVVLP